MSREVSSLADEGESVGLHRFALLTACFTALLIFVGGLVTSTESGLSVPDWPTTYGWNMFTFPFSKWVGGIVYEHSNGGVIVTAMIVWTFSRIARSYSDHSLLYKPALAMLLLVGVQLMLGALTVWTSKAVVPTTAHVATGAFVLGTSLLLTLRTYGMVAVRVPAWK